MIAQSESSIGAHARKDATEANAEIIALAYKLTQNGPDLETLQKLKTICELLAIRLESLQDSRLAPQIAPVLYRGSYCRSIRERFHLSQRDVADLGGIHEKTVRDIESFRRSTNQDTMLRMSFALKTPAAKLWPSLCSVPSEVK